MNVDVKKRFFLYILYVCIFIILLRGGGVYAAWVFGATHPRGAAAIEPLINVIFVVSRHGPIEYLPRTFPRFIRKAGLHRNHYPGSQQQYIKYIEHINI